MTNDNDEVRLMDTSIAEWMGYKPKPEPKPAPKPKNPKPDFRLVQIGWGVVAVPLRPR